MEKENSIFVVLPRKEKIAGAGVGAVALTVCELVRHSRFQSETKILASGNQFAPNGVTLQNVDPRDRWFRSRSMGYALGCLDTITKHAPAFVDVHNRPNLFRVIQSAYPVASVSLWLHNDPQLMAGSKTLGQRKEILKKAKWIFCVSGFIRDRFLDGIAQTSQSVLVVPNVIDLTNLSLTNKEKLITFIGRPIAEKGVLEFAKGFALAARNLEGWRVAMVGVPAPGERVSPYVASVHSALRGLDSRVRYTGALPHAEAMRILAQSEIAIVPSRWEEPFGRTAMEAMAFGAALIASRRGGLPEVAGEAALWLDDPSPEEISSKLLQLACNERVRKNLQSAAKVRVERFDASINSLAIDQLRFPIRTQ